MEISMTQLAFSVDQAAVAVRAMLARGPWTRAPVDGVSDSGGNLRAIGPVWHFAQDRDIYGEGDYADVFFKVVSGVVRTCKFLAMAGAKSIPSMSPATCLASKRERSTASAPKPSAIAPSFHTAGWALKCWR
jgi:hypothetical protein